jgi:hypothetical protein
MIQHIGILTVAQDTSYRLCRERTVHMYWKSLRKKHSYWLVDTWSLELALLDFEWVAQEAQAWPRGQPFDDLMKVGYQSCQSELWLMCFWCTPMPLVKWACWETGLITIAGWNNGLNTDLEHFAVICDVWAALRMSTTCNWRHILRNMNAFIQAHILKSEPW